MLSPELMGLSCGTDVVCAPTLRRDTGMGTKAYPPIAIDCGATFNWRDQQCGNDGALAAYATELDFLQFFWAIHAQGVTTERFTMDDIFSTLRAACSGSWQQCSSGDELRWESVAGMPASSARSLEDGAVLYLNGAPDKLSRFQTQAANHGLTPPQAP